MKETRKRPCVPQTIVRKPDGKRREESYSYNGYNIGIVFKVEISKNNK